MNINLKHDFIRKETTRIANFDSLPADRQELFIVKYASALHDGDTTENNVRRLQAVMDEFGLKEKTWDQWKAEKGLQA